MAVHNLGSPARNLTSELQSELIEGAFFVIGESRVTLASLDSLIARMDEMESDARLIETHAIEELEAARRNRQNIDALLGTARTQIARQVADLDLEEAHEREIALRLGFQHLEVKA